VGYPGNPLHEIVRVKQSHAVEQQSMGQRYSPLIIMLYADETKLTDFGNTTAWSVYFWLGNLPCKTRASFDTGGATLLAYLPKASNIADA
jgi:hypothetical protein